MSRNIAKPYRQIRPGVLVIWLWLTLAGGARAQIGTWRPHVSYRSAQSVAVVGQQVYTATANGLFVYDKTTGETTTLTRQNGLTDVGISRLLYLPDQSRLLIAYQTGTIDLLTVLPTGEPGQVQPITTIAAATSLPAARTINFVSRIGNLAYLSTDFGLVVLNLTTGGIQDTYFSQRADGSALPIYQTTVANDSLYALTAPLTATGTARQIRAVRFSATTNIADPANWRPVASPPGSPETLITRQGQLSATINGQGIYGRTAGRWSLLQTLSASPVRQFVAGSTATTDVIVVAGSAITAPAAGTVSSSLFADPREVVADGTNLWIADTRNGLLLSAGGTVRGIAPPGPDRDSFATLYAYPNQLVALPNGPQEATLLSANLAAASRLDVSANQWQSLMAPAIDRGFTSAAYLAASQTLYLGGFGSGLWQQSADQPAPVLVALPATIDPFITSLATDNDGNLWIATGGTSAARAATLHVRRPDGTFASFSAITTRTIVQIVPDDAGYLWLRLTLGNGLLVFDPQTSRSRTLTTLTDAGGLLTSSVRALAKDRSGAIWVGTDLGPTVFDNLTDPFAGIINAQPPIINRRRLLINELVTAIAVDGGNRKWIATRTGLYRVSPDGSQLLDTFTDDTSPLPLRAVTALAIDPASGRLFMQTTNGLISYQTTASDPADALSSLTIFPNPVRPDFTGSVGIRGLTDNATVKILDAGGQLVYETRSQGGTATWNLLDYRGRSAQTGVYLVVVVASDGSEGIAGKLAVVR